MIAEDLRHLLDRLEDADLRAMALAKLEGRSLGDRFDRRTPESSLTLASCSYFCESSGDTRPAICSERKTFGTT